MADWYVYQHDGDPLGPLSTDAVADAILTGKLAPDVWVAAPGGPRWLSALEVPVIGRLVEGVPTTPRRRDSGLRLIPGAFTSDPDRAQLPFFGATMLMVTDDEVDVTDSSGDRAGVTTRRGLPASASAGDTAPMAAVPAMSAYPEAREEGDDQVTRIALDPRTAYDSLEDDVPSSDPGLAERRRKGA